MKKYSVVMEIYDDNLGLEMTTEKFKLLRYHMDEGNINFGDFEIQSIEEVIEASIKGEKG